jgi:hypothetical protein
VNVEARNLLGRLREARTEAAAVHYADVCMIAE